MAKEAIIIEEIVEEPETKTICWLTWPRVN